MSFQNMDNVAPFLLQIWVLLQEILILEDFPQSDKNNKFPQFWISEQFSINLGVTLERKNAQNEHHFPPENG